jgi:hypothetical protein
MRGTERLRPLSLILAPLRRLVTATRIAYSTAAEFLGAYFQRCSAMTSDKIRNPIISDERYTRLQEELLRTDQLIDQWKARIAQYAALREPMDGSSTAKRGAQLTRQAVNYVVRLAGEKAKGSEGSGPTCSGTPAVATSPTGAPSYERCRTTSATEIQAHSPLRSGCRTSVRGPVDVGPRSSARARMRVTIARLPT